MIMQRSLILGASLLLGLCQVHGQDSSFEVASIKINKAGGSDGSAGLQGGNFIATNVTLRTLLIYAYKPSDGFFLDTQIVNLPDWARIEHFDIQAKPGGNSTTPAIEQIRSMLRSLLADRFQLKAHRELRDLPVYNLVLKKNGIKLSEDQTPPSADHNIISFSSEGAELGAVPRGELRVITGPSITTIVGSAIPVRTLVDVLQQQSDRLIDDKTSFTKLIDVHLEFTRDVLESLPGSDLAGDRTSAPNQLTQGLSNAIQELGFKLIPGKARMEALVIDNVQHPSNN